MVALGGAGASTGRPKLVEFRRCRQPRGLGSSVLGTDLLEKGRQRVGAPSDEVGWIATALHGRYLD